MKRQTIGGIIIGLVMVALLVLGMGLAYFYTQPIGPSMSLAGPNPSLARPVSAVQVSKDLAPTPTAFAAAPPTQAPQKFCGNTGKMTVLVVGSDSNPLIPPPGSDLVRYVQVDFDQQKVTIFTFPRSLWLTTPTLADLKINETTLGMSYDYRYQAAKAQAADADEKKLTVTASQTVAQVVLDTFNLRPDHYVAVKLSALPRLVDAVDGVTIDNPVMLVTTYNPPFTFQPGVQTINGQQVSSYVRFMDDTHSDWDRIARQNLVLQALYTKLEDPATLSKIPGFFNELIDSFVTDLSAENITDLTCVLQSVEDDNIIQEKVHPEMVSAGPQGSQLPDVAKIEDLLKSLGMVP